MTMGSRIRQARQEQGLSQRQLAGEEMTRNMLSALEHDAANPSVATLRYLSEKLCKPISYFLGEDVLSNAEGEAMARARAACGAKDWAACLAALEGLSQAEHSQERLLLQVLALLGQAEEELRLGRKLCAVDLLERCQGAGEGCLYYSPELEDRRRLLLWQAGGAAAAVGNVDAYLACKAEAALAQGKAERAAQLLQAMEEQQSPLHSRLMGHALFAQGDYRGAAGYYHRCEGPEEIRARLEVCYRELGDYKLAYYYATQKH